MALHNELGKTGEELTVEYLQGKGYTIRDVNWRSGHLELDVVAHIDNQLVVVEVKTRRENSLVSPSDAVDSRKIRRLVNAAEAYIRRYDIPFEVRFDIVSIIITEHDGVQIEHIEDAFFPPMNMR